MKPRDLLVRCMAWRDHDLWIAASIDFGLAAQAFTLDEAKSKLHAQIATYVRDAFTSDSAHADILLKRRAPLADQLRYAFWHWVAQQPSLRHRAKKTVDAIGIAIRNKFAYEESLPLRAA